MAQMRSNKQLTWPPRQNICVLILGRIGSAHQTFKRSDAVAGHPGTRLSGCHHWKLNLLTTSCPLLQLAIRCAITNGKLTITMQTQASFSYSDHP
jgi:hypothetical protein